MVQLAAGFCTCPKLGDRGNRVYEKLIVLTTNWAPNQAECGGTGSLKMLFILKHIFLLLNLNFVGGGSLKMSKTKFLKIIQLLFLPLKNNGTVSRSLCLVVQKYKYKCLYNYDMNDFVVKVKLGTH